MRKLMIRGLLAAAVLATVMGLSGCGGDASSAPLASEKGPPAVPVEVAAVTMGELAPAYSATTNLEAEREAKVMAEVPGEVVAVLVEEGDHVAAGQVLARIDGARAAIELRQAKGVVDRLANDAKRNEELIERHMISRDAYDRTRFERDVQVAAVGLAANTLEKTEIRAPYAGVITRRWVKQGQWLKVQDVAFELADFSQLKARVHVPERVSGLIRPGQPVRFTADALGGREFTATIARVSPVVDRGSGTVGATIEVANPDESLRPGLFVRLAINYERISSAVLVPKSAVVSDIASTHVYVIEKSKAKKRAVTLGLENGSSVQVTSGLEPGMTVVTVGQQSLKDGDLVDVVRPAEIVAASQETAALN